MARLDSGPLAAALETNRSVLNALFAEASIGLNETDRDRLAAEYSRSLVDIVDPVVRGLDQTGMPVAVAFELAKITLQLSARRAMSDVVALGWRRLIPLAPDLLATSGSRFLGGITNALSNIELSPNARPTSWVETAERVLTKRKNISIETFERVGVVAAWRAGMPQFREAALRQLETLDVELASLALGCTSALPTDRISRTISDPWFDPTTGEPTKRIGRIGNFRGLGGTFQKPPLLLSGSSEPVVTDGSTDWLLLADHTGLFLQRIGERDSKQPVQANNERFAPLPKVVHDSVVEPTSWLQTSTTIYATSATSYAVTVIPV